VKRDKDYRLTKTQRQQLLVKQNNNIRNVLDLYCLDRGCIQSRIQLYLSGNNFKVIPTDCIHCGNVCTICTGQWKRYFLPVRKDGIYWPSSRTQTIFRVIQRSASSLSQCGKLNIGSKQYSTLLLDQFVSTMLKLCSYNE